MFDHALSDLRFTENPELAGSVEYTDCEFINLCIDGRYSSSDFTRCTFKDCSFQDFECASFNSCEFIGGSFHPDPFSSSYFSGCSFTCVDLVNVKYAESFENCTFTGCDIRGAVFGKLSQCRFDHCNLSHATIESMSGCAIVSCDAPWLSLKTISNSSFESVDFGTTLKIEGGYFEDSIFLGCSLNRAEFKYGQFVSLVFNSCLMAKAVFEDCEADRLSFYSCETTKTIFIRVNFDGGCFSVLDGMPQSQARSMEFNCCQFENDHMFDRHDMQKSLFFDCHDIALYFTGSNLSGIQLAACSGEVTHSDCIAMSPLIDQFSCDNLEFCQY